MKALHIYLQNPRVKRILGKGLKQDGFSLVELVVVIAVLAILSAVAVPAFVGVQANAQASAVQNGLVNGIKECVVRDSDSNTTTFVKAQSFANPTAFKGYTIGKLTADDDTCFKAKATATDTTNMSNFTITLDKNTGVVVRQCTPASTTGKKRPGCGSAATGDSFGTW